ncbi:MAG: hypothetical protein JST16_07265 [Bdellovibrionales bacterium]|nr:hypothetical protein [Bdellovibrionales bacterium]
MLLVLLGLVRCGVKLPPKPQHEQMGPLSSYEKPSPSEEKAKDGQKDKTP